MPYQCPVWVLCASQIQSIPAPVGRFGTDPRLTHHPHLSWLSRAKAILASNYSKYENCPSFSIDHFNEYGRPCMIQQAKTSEKEVRPLYICTTTIHTFYMSTDTFCIILFRFIEQNQHIIVEVCASQLKLTTLVQLADHFICKHSV